MAASLGTTTASGEFVAPFVPSPEVLVDRMLEIARVGPGDTVYDLGAGDGRIVVAAAQRFGAHAVGIELDDNRFALASARIRDLGLCPRARMEHGDLLDTDLRPATVVTLYQLPAVNERLRPALERQLYPSARVVTLDFPVQGWKATKVLTAQVDDGSKHAIYLYWINEIRKESTTMADKLADKYSPGSVYLELKGVPAGLLLTADGGDATAEVVEEKPGTDGIVRKHIAGVKYEDLTVSFGAGMSNDLYDWIDATLRRTTQRLDGAIVVADLNGTEVSRLNFYNAIIREIGFPALDAYSKDAARITLKFAPEYTRRVKGSGLKLAQPLKSKTTWLSANFRLQIEGLDCSRVSRIEPLIIIQPVTTEAVGAFRDYAKELAALEIPNLAVTLSEMGSETFSDWHDDFVIKGDNGQAAEKNGTLQFLSPNLNEVLFVLTLRHLGIFKLAREKHVAGSDAISRLRAEMYCEELLFQYGASASRGNDAGAGTADSSAAAWKQDTGASTSTRIYPGTQTVRTVYVQPFSADAALKSQLSAQSPDPATAPLRLGRPLKFRS